MRQSSGIQNEDNISINHVSRAMLEIFAISILINHYNSEKKKKKKKKKKDGWVSNYTLYRKKKSIHQTLTSLWNIQVVA